MAPQSARILLRRRYPLPPTRASVCPLSPTGQTSQATTCIASTPERHHRASRLSCPNIISDCSTPRVRNRITCRTTTETIRTHLNIYITIYHSPATNTSTIHHTPHTHTHHVLLHQLRTRLPRALQRERRPLRLLRHPQPKVHPHALHLLTLLRHRQTPGPLLSHDVLVRLARPGLAAKPVAVAVAAHLSTYLYLYTPATMLLYSPLLYLPISSTANPHPRKTTHRYEHLDDLTIEFLATIPPPLQSNSARLDSAQATPHQHLKGRVFFFRAQSIYTGGKGTNSHGFSAFFFLHFFDYWGRSVFSSVPIYHFFFSPRETRFDSTRFDQGVFFRSHLSIDFFAWDDFLGTFGIFFVAAGFSLERLLSFRLHSELGSGFGMLEVFGNLEQFNQHLTRDPKNQKTPSRRILT